MSTSQPIRIAMVGTGAIARVAHLPALRGLADDVDVVAAVDVDADQLTEVADEWQIPGRYGSVTAMLTAESPDLVIVASPPAVHREQVNASLAAGAWVLCEKPAALSLADYDAMTAGEGEGGPYAAVVFQQRYGSGAIHTRKLLAKGELGRPLVAQCSTTWFRDDNYFEAPWRGSFAGDGGPLTSLGVHLMDVLLTLLGPWHEVVAFGQSASRNIDAGDVNTAIVRFDNGALATLVTSAVSPRQESYLRIDTELTTIEATYLYNHEASDWSCTPLPPSAPGAELVAAAWKDGPAAETSGHLPMLRSLIADIRAGRRPDTSGAGGRDALELITAIYKSAFTKSAVQRGEISPGDPFYSQLNGGYGDFR